MITRLDLFTSLPQGASVCEVGVMAGDFMKQIVGARPDLLYTGVDNWQGRFETFLPYVQAYAAQYHRVRVQRAESIVAARDYGASFDLVYIDAYHTYEAVKADLKAWLPAVKPGGILAGHDYETKPESPQWEAIEVQRAVDEWAMEWGYEVGVILEPCPSWYVRV